MKRWLCALRGHRERFTAFDPPKVIATPHGPWICQGKVECRCGETKVFEGVQLVSRSEVQVLAARDAL